MRMVLLKLTTTVFFVIAQSMINQSLYGKQLTAIDHQAGIFQYKLHTCRNDSYSPLQKIPGYSCPKHAPIPYARTNKYPSNIRFKYVPNKPPDIHYGCHNPPFTCEFCNGEILQLRTDMPKNLSNETAIAVSFGIVNEMPFFCPKQYSTFTSHGKYDYCPSQACKQRLPFRSGDSHDSYGDFALVNDSWILNITLRESPGRRALTMYTFSCPPDNCILWQGVGPNPQCCTRSINFDLMIRDTERNSFRSPANSIGGGEYNVTVHKQSSFIGIVVSDTIHNETVDSFATEEGDTDLVLTLPLGVYQVSGNVSHQCGAAEMERPITLLPLNATYSPIETLSFSKRRLSWKTHGDLPIKQFEFYPQDDPKDKKIIHEESFEFSIEGHMINKPAPVYRTFVHKVCYDGVNDADNPRELIPINLSAFQPSNVTYTSSTHSTSLSWSPPEEKTEHVSTYRLIVDSTANNPQRVFIIEPNGLAMQNFSYTHFRYLASETVRIKLSAIFWMEVNPKEHIYWWGPVRPVLIEIAASSISSTTNRHSPTHSIFTSSTKVHSTTPPRTSVSTTRVFPSHSTTVEPVLPSASSNATNENTSGHNLAIILGGTAGGLVVVCGTVTAVIITVSCLCRRSYRGESLTLFNPAADFD